MIDSKLFHSPQGSKFVDGPMSGNVLFFWLCFYWCRCQEAKSLAFRTVSWSIMSPVWPQAQTLATSIIFGKWLLKIFLYLFCCTAVCRSKLAPRYCMHQHLLQLATSVSTHDTHWWHQQLNCTPCLKSGLIMLLFHVVVFLWCKDSKKVNICEAFSETEDGGMSLALCNSRYGGGGAARCACI